tara:strand:+ start:9175 stop:9696 length:522 start_codon:yes stop_codon:yes gene_type:complete
MAEITKTLDDVLGVVRDRYTDARDVIAEQHNKGINWLYSKRAGMYAEYLGALASGLVATTYTTEVMDPERKMGPLMTEIASSFALNAASHYIPQQHQQAVDPDMKYFDDHDLIKYRAMKNAAAVGIGITLESTIKEPTTTKTTILATSIALLAYASIRSEISRNRFRRKEKID